MVARILKNTFCLVVAFGLMSACVPAQKIPKVHLTNYQPKYFKSFKNTSGGGMFYRRIEVLEGVPDKPYLILGEIDVGSFSISWPHDRLLDEAVRRARKAKGDGIMNLKYAVESHSESHEKRSGSALGGTVTPDSEGRMAAQHGSEAQYRKYTVRRVTGQVFIYRANLEEK